MAAPKLDVFATLAAADAKKVDYYTNLSVEEQKGYAPSVVTRWMSGVPNPQQVMMINEFLNPYAFSLYKHPELLWKLSTIVTAGHKQRYTWIKPPSKGTVGKSNAIKLVMEYFNYSSSKATDALPLLNRDQILSMAEDLGWPSEDIAKLRRELK